MTAARDNVSLVLDRGTVAALYDRVPRGRRERRIPLSPEILEVLPARARQAIRKALARNGMEAFLVEREDALCVVIRNKRRY